MEDSVTQFFYEQGWCGINIEPVLEGYEKFKYSRKRDINLQIAISNEDNFVTLYQVWQNSKITGLNTTDSRIASNHSSNGSLIKETIVRSQTLQKVFEKYCANTEVHFLKIDVEGAELSVLRSSQFTNFRPWIILFEATIPNTNTPSFLECHEYLISKDYFFVYFDGLNRFYVAKEKSELEKNFLLPPNLTDGFELSPRKIKNEYQRIAMENHELKLELKNIQNSISWKLTFPLRLIKARLKSIAMRD